MMMVIRGCSYYQHIHPYALFVYIADLPMMSLQPRCRHNNCNSIASVSSREWRCQRHGVSAYTCWWWRSTTWGECQTLPGRSSILDHSDVLEHLRRLVVNEERHTLWTNMMLCSPPSEPSLKVLIDDKGRSILWTGCRKGWYPWKKGEGMRRYHSSAKKGLRDVSIDTKIHYPSDNFPSNQRNEELLLGYFILSFWSYLSFMLACCFSSDLKE